MAYLVTTMPLNQMDLLFLAVHAVPSHNRSAQVLMVQVTWLILQYRQT